jgi:uncharacterized membrane protein
VIQLPAVPDRIFYCVSYAVFALPLILFYTFFIPPFQVPDESSHFARAYQLTQGEFFPTKQADADAPGGYIVGGTVDPGIYSAADKLIYLEFNPAAKYSMAKAVTVNRFKWGEGEMRDTRSVSVNAPTFYAVPALGVMLGQYLDKSIVQTLSLSRLANGLFALVVSCIAMLTLRRGYGVLFVLLLMPMTLAQMASTSQDGICFAVAALCVALMSQLNPELPQRRRRITLILSTLLLITVITARTPYAALALFFLYFAYTFRARTDFAIECCMAFAVTLIATLSWSLYVAVYVSVPFGLEGADWGEQARFVLQSPLEWVGILAESWRQRWSYYLSSFVGIVGHLDTRFPNSYLSLTGVVLGLAFFMSYWPERNTLFRSMSEQALVPCLIVLATIVGIFLVLYISWSPLQYPIIEGPQGRYFIPAALFLALGTSASTLTGGSQFVYRCVVIAFAAYTLVITPYVVMARYY